MIYLISTAYLCIGIALLIRDITKPLPARPAYLFSKTTSIIMFSSFLAILLWPIILLVRGPKQRKGKMEMEQYLRENFMKQDKYSPEVIEELVRRTMKSMGL